MVSSKSKNTSVPLKEYMDTMLANLVTKEDLQIALKPILERLSWNRGRDFAIWGFVTLILAMTELILHTMKH